MKRIRPSYEGCPKRRFSSPNVHLKFTVNEFVRISVENKVFEAKIVRILPGSKYRVHFVGWNASFDEEFDAGIAHDVFQSIIAPTKKFGSKQLDVAPPDNEYFLNQIRDQSSKKFPIGIDDLKTHLLMEYENEGKITPLAYGYLDKIRRKVGDNEFKSSIANLFKENQIKESFDDVLNLMWETSRPTNSQEVDVHESVKVEMSDVDEIAMTYIGPVKEETQNQINRNKKARQSSHLFHSNTQKSSTQQPNLQNMRGMPFGQYNNVSPMMGLNSMQFPFNMYNPMGLYPGGMQIPQHVMNLNGGINTGFLNYLPMPINNPMINPVSTMNVFSQIIKDEAVPVFAYPPTHIQNSELTDKDDRSSSNAQCSTTVPESGVEFNSLLVQRTNNEQALSVSNDKVHFAEKELSENITEDQSLSNVADILVCNTFEPIPGNSAGRVECRTISSENAIGKTDNYKMQGHEEYVVNLSEQSIESVAMDEPVVEITSLVNELINSIVIDESIDLSEIGLEVTQHSNVDTTEIKDDLFFQSIEEQSKGDICESDDDDDANKDGIFSNLTEEILKTKPSGIELIGMDYLSDESDEENIDSYSAETRKKPSDGSDEKIDDAHNTDTNNTVFIAANSVESLNSLIVPFGYEDSCELKCTPVLNIAPMVTPTKIPDLSNIINQAQPQEDNDVKPNMHNLTNTLETESRSVNNPSCESSHQVNGVAVKKELE